MTTSIIEIKVTGSGTELSPGGGSGGGASGGLLAAGGKLGIIAGAAMAVVSILKDMLWVFKPVQSILKAIARTLGLFLEPIARLLQAFLMPVLAFVRPAAMLFRAMMAPVMGLLRQFSAVMSAQMGSGDIVGATQTGFDMVGLALGGFFISLANVVGKMLINVMGKLLETLAHALIDFAVLLLTPLTIIIDKFVPGISGLTDSLNASALELKGKVTANFKLGIESAEDALTLGTTTMMDSLIKLYTDKLVTLKGVVEINLPPSIQPFNDIIANTSDSTAYQVAQLESSTTTSLQNMQTQTGSTMNPFYPGSIPSRFNKGLQTMQAGITTFVSDVENAGRRISKALKSAEESSRHGVWFEFGYRP